jgi:hypothetical protein
MVLGMRRPSGVPFLLVLGGIAWAGVHAIAHRAAGLEGSASTSHAHGAGSPAYLSTSLTLCLSLALVLAAASSVYPRWRPVSGRSLWLFGAVPMLGLLAGTVADSDGSPAGMATDVAELLPVAALVLVVQVSVAVGAVRVARGLLDLVEGTVRALVGPFSARQPDGTARFFLLDADRVPAVAPAFAGSPRAPPAPTSAV